MNEELMVQANDALDKAKIRLLSGKQPGMLFMAHLFLNLKFKWDESMPTAWVDGITMGINPQFFVNLGDPKLQMAVVVHETYHVALKHFARLGSRDRKVWNFAGDYIINSYIQRMGLLLGKGWLYAKEYDGDEWTTELVYEDLMKNPEKQPQSSSMDGDILPAGEGTEGDGASPDEIQQRVEAAVLKAFNTAKMQQGAKFVGTGSPELDRMVDNLLNPILPWHTILRKTTTSIKRDDYSYRRFNKRFMPKFYLPTLYSDSVPAIDIYIDTSGSVSDEDFRTFLSECQAIQRNIKPECMRFYSFDHQLYEPQILKRNQRVGTVSMKGGGGTCIEPVLTEICKNKAEISLIFTDGYYDRDPRLERMAANSTRLIYLIYDNGNWSCDHGKVIHFSLPN